MSRIALIGENSSVYVSLLIDIWNNHDCAVLLDWRIPYAALIDLMTEAKVEKCYIDEKIYNKFALSLDCNIEFITYDNHVTTEYIPSEICDKYMDNYSEDEAIIIYSSGTTGRSKGIILSHRAIQLNADAIIDYMQPNTSDVIYIVKTISHSSTITGELLVGLKSKMRIVIAPVIVPPRIILRNIIQYQVSIVCINPTLAALMCDEVERQEYHISSLRKIYVSGSILYDHVYDRLHKLFDAIEIYNVYGLSEAGPRVTAQTASTAKINSVGKPICGVDIMVVDDTGAQVECYEKGYVHIKTPCLYNGYVHGKAKNASLVDDWYNTGDIGYLDADNELHIIGRSDDVIIIHSHKIYPYDIETCILDTGLINECIVTVNEANGMLYCLYTGDKISANQLRYKLRFKLMDYEIPYKFIHCYLLPKTMNNKVKKEDIQKLISDSYNEEK